MTERHEILNMIDDVQSAIDEAIHEGGTAEDVSVTMHLNDAVPFLMIGVQKLHLAHDALCKIDGGGYLDQPEN